MALFSLDLDINGLISVLQKYKTLVIKVLYIDLLWCKFGLSQSLNSIDNAREAYTESPFPDVKFT